MKRVILLLLCLIIFSSCQGSKTAERVHFSKDELPFSVDLYTYTSAPTSDIKTSLKPLIDAARGHIVNIRENKNSSYIAVSTLELSLERDALGALSLLVEDMVSATNSQKQLLIRASYSDIDPLYPDFVDGFSFQFAFFDGNVYPMHHQDVQAESAFIQQNAAKYGFIFRYAPNYEEETGIADNAVLRYVGARVATFMDKAGICLEEFISLVENTSPARALSASDGAYTDYFFLVDQTETEISLSGDSYFELIQLSDMKLLAVMWEANPDLPPKNGITVFLDPGHGALNENGVADRGAGENSFYNKMTGLLESDLNLILAKAIKEQLVAAGYTVIMSREGFYPHTMTISDRAKIANESGADIFISVHANSFANDAAYGSRVYYCKNQSNAKESKSLAAAFAKAMGNYPGISGKKFSPENADYVVIRDTEIPAILIESCFLTNQEDAQNAADPAWIRAFAYAAREGVDAYFDLGDNV